jgi:hypothetical protein
METFMVASDASFIQEFFENCAELNFNSKIFCTLSNISWIIIYFESWTDLMPQ